MSLETRSPGAAIGRETRRDARLVLLILASACLAAPVGAADERGSAGESGFAGVWAIAASTDDVVLKSKAGDRDAAGGGLEASGRRGVGDTFDLPLEVMTDARRLVVTDDGTTLRVTYPSGRKRTFVTDGEKRYLDDGDGPADVVARRKAESVTVTSEWFRGYKLTETWEVRTDPRRLVVTGKLKGRESNSYRRTYEPGKALPEAARAATPAPAASGPAASPAKAAEAAPAPAPSTPPSVDRLAECSVRPPRHTEGEELRRLARISQDAAGKAAVASLAPLKPDDVISSDAENYEGCLVWPFTLRLAPLHGVQEVFVDAGDGKVVKSEFVPVGPARTEAP